MAEHTPGDWAVLDGFPGVIVMAADRKLANGGSIHASDYGTRYARQIARVLVPAPNMPGSLEANAHLFAAAPELLEALDNLIWEIGDMSMGSELEHRVREARAVLDKHRQPES